mgnify:CR=1 FL=1
MEECVSESDLALIQRLNDVMREPLAVQLFVHDYLVKRYTLQPGEMVDGVDASAITEANGIT